MTSTFSISDGSQLGYTIIGKEHLSRNVVPLVIVNGMSMRFEDWEVISKPLSEKRPILLFDHRDIGSSIIATSKRGELSIALMANDAVALIKSLGWKTVDIMGFSMGGSILQQILTTPSLPFTISHALLTATTTKAPHGDPAFLDFMTRPPSKSGPLTDAEKIELARPMVEFGYDEAWLSDPKNRALVDAKLPSQIFARPASIIAKQGMSVRESDHRPNLSKIPSSIAILVIHGKLDRIIHYGESEYIVRGIAHARRIPIDPQGKTRGAIPSDAFGHTWYDYFDPAVWISAVETFLSDEGVYASNSSKAKL